MKKLIVDGKVAVLISHGYGAGWSSGGNLDPFDPVLAEMLHKNCSREALFEEAKKRYPNEYLGGIVCLRIEWVPVGTRFRIHEYDGFESLIIYNPEDYYEA